MKKRSKKRSKAERETQALLRKISKKSENSPKDSAKKYIDRSIISDYSDADISSNSLFQEMKRREF